MRWLAMLLLFLLPLGAQSPGVSLQPPGRGYELQLKWASTDAYGLPLLSAYGRDGGMLMEAQPSFQVEAFPASGEWRRLNSTPVRADETWQPVYGERASYENRYRGLLVDFSSSEGGEALLRLEVRAYNEGLAWRVHFLRSPSGGAVRIAAENTTFRFPEGTYGWATYRAQAEYERVPLGQVKEGCERPLTLEYTSGKFAALAEAGLDNFARMKFGPAGGGALKTQLASPVELSAPFATPWRVLILGNSAGQLIEHNYLLLNLNEPSKINDPSWIKPGKVMREVTLSTKGGKELVDFAVAHKIDFIEYDAGWYGHEYDAEQDARTVTPDPDRTRRVPDWGGLQLQEVIDYARSKGVGVILYVNRRHLEKQLDELLPLYKSWGVAGLKYGFVNVGSQEWTTWLHDAVRKAAAHELMVDVHDEYRPTGLSRTWPNLMTQEGILGNEAMPDATHNMVLPFTRGVAGAGDYTICYYTPRIKTTHAHQLALSVIMYSPWQFVFWYDRPSDYQNEPEMAFFEDLPTVWDETRVLSGDVGQYISIARRKNHSWWVATATNTEARNLGVPLDFLKIGMPYAVERYEDGRSDAESGSAPGAQMSNRTKVRVSKCMYQGHTMGTTGVLLQLPPSGGNAMVFRPLAEGEERTLPACKWPEAPAR